MTYEFIDHTADVAVELRVPSREELFAEALRAFTDTVTEIGKVDGDSEKTLSVEATGLDDLMVEWLGELVYRFDVDGLLYSAAEVRIEERDGALCLTAEARGATYDEERHPLKVEVKGVTYHDLLVEEAEDGSWRGRVVFDI